jgi:hypothetical protein
MVDFFVIGSSRNTFCCGCWMQHIPISSHYLPYLASVGCGVIILWTVSDNKSVFTQQSQCSSGLWAGWLRNEGSIPSSSKRFFSSLQHACQLSFFPEYVLSSGKQGVVPLRWSSQGVNLSTHLHLMLRLRIYGAVPLLRHIINFFF